MHTSPFQDEIIHAVRTANAPLLERINELERIIRNVSENDHTVISLSDAAKKLGCHEETLRRQIRSGKLKCIRRGRRIYFNAYEFFTNHHDK